MDVIATKLEAEAKAREKGLDKAKALLKRVNWLRAAKLVAGSAVAMSFGLPPTGLIGEIWGLGQRVARRRRRRQAAGGGESQGRRGRGRRGRASQAEGGDLAT